MIYTVLFRPKGIDELQRYPIEATDEKDAVEKVKQKVSGPVGDVNIVSVVKGNYLDRRPKHFEALSEIKDELFDAPEDVRVAFNNLIKYFDIYDEFGESLRISDEVIFYYAEGIEDIDVSNKTTPRLYKGKLKKWDGSNLIGTIETKDFDQTRYKLPKEVKVTQRLIKKL